MIEEPKRSEVLKRLENVINCLSLENGSDTPDWILARYLIGCLDIFDVTVQARDEWHGYKPKPATAPLAGTAQEGKGQ